MPCGDASSYLKATNDTFFELAESIDPGENQEETAAKLKMGIKSIMTDRHVVNKAYKKMLENEKLKAIEEIEVTNKTTYHNSFVFYDLRSSGILRPVNISFYYCLLGLPSQANSVLFKPLLEKSTSSSA
jgi:hypothetical protein